MALTKKEVNERLTRFESTYKNTGIKVTRQRREIYKEAASSESHPDAEMIYKAVQLRIPEISLDTVYRTSAVPFGYEPNSYSEWQERPEVKEPPLVIDGAANHWSHREDDDDYYSQPGWSTTHAYPESLILDSRTKTIPRNHESRMMLALSCDAPTT